MGFRTATARGTDVIIYLNASVSFTALLTSKPKSWETSFTADKDFQNFFSSRFHLLGLL